jgi:hypothetical protein
MGRPNKLAPEVRESILRSMRLGLFAEQAAQLAGIAERTLDDWIRKGRDGVEPYASFYSDFSAAKAQGEQSYVGVIGKAAAGGNWNAAAWILERRHPKRWGPKVRMIVEEEQRDFLERLRARLTPEAYAAVIRAATDDSGPTTDAGEGEPH